MRKDVVKLIKSAARYYRPKDVRRNPGRVLKAKYNRTPPRQRPALLAYWRAEVERAKQLNSA